MTGRTCRIAQTGLQGQSALGGPSFSCLWLVLWSKAKAKIQTTRNSCKKQRKRPLFKQKEGVLWSCYPDLNRRPHPYQLIGRVRSAAFGAFLLFFVRSAVLSGTLVSVDSVRFFRRVGHGVGQPATYPVFYPHKVQRQPSQLILEGASHSESAPQKTTTALDGNGPASVSVF